MNKQDPLSSKQVRSTEQATKFVETIWNLKGPETQNSILEKKNSRNALKEVIKVNCDILKYKPLNMNILLMFLFGQYTEGYFVSKENC